LQEPDFTGLAAARVTVVGLGLMGGSFALALRGHCRELVGADHDPAALELARATSVVDRTAPLAEAVECDLLVLGAPVRAILSQLQALTQLPRPQQRVVVLDLGSTKAEVVQAMATLPAGYDPIGGHPMCGKETSGLANADAGLFRGKVFVLTPLPRTTPGALALALAAAGALGAQPWVLAPEQHDALAAYSSHLPYAVAALLVRTAQAAGDEQIWRMAASGFRDTSRLASSDVTMMLDILLTNREPVLAALAGFRAELDDLRRLLSDGDVERLRSLLTDVRAQRGAHFA
jgi:prephenate dehydrogenase